MLFTSSGRIRFNVLISEEGVGQIRGIEEEGRVALVRILVGMVDALRGHTAGPSHQAMNLVALLRRNLGQIRAVLAGDARDECLPDG